MAIVQKRRQGLSRPSGGGSTPFLVHFCTSSTSLENTTTGRNKGARDKEVLFSPLVRLERSAYCVGGEERKRKEGGGQGSKIRELARETPAASIIRRPRADGD